MNFEDRKEPFILPEKLFPRFESELQNLLARQSSYKRLSDDMRKVAKGSKIKQNMEQANHYADVLDKISRNIDELKAIVYKSTLE